MPAIQSFASVNAGSSPRFLFSIRAAGLRQRQSDWLMSLRKLRITSRAASALALGSESRVNMKDTFGVDSVVAKATEVFAFQPYPALKDRAKLTAPLRGEKNARTRPVKIGRVRLSIVAVGLILASAAGLYPRISY